jgi:D-inositol-3-phosphate glycosyltransferase
MTFADDMVLDSPSGVTVRRPQGGGPGSVLAVTLLTGGIDRPYLFGLSTALLSKGVSLDVVGGTDLQWPDLLANSKVNFLNLHGDQRQLASLASKLWRQVVFYVRLMGYAATARPKIFHILWNNKFQLFDRTALMLYYKMLGKKVVFTAHNVNAAKRDGNDSALNRLSLRVQYRLADHIFVHTEKMKQELVDEFGIRGSKVSVIPFGLNNSVPDTDLTCTEAKQKLGIRSGEKTILFFGRIRQYKGLGYLVPAFQRIARDRHDWRLIIAGEPKKDSVGHWRDMQKAIEQDTSGKRVVQEIRYIADDETEIFFKAADVLVLPYTQVFQSGVLFLAYSFGLPVIATDVGSFRDDIVEGETGYICRPSDEADLAGALETYFESSLFKNLDHRRSEIKAFAQTRNSWNAVSDTTCDVYSQLLAKVK